MLTQRIVVCLAGVIFVWLPTSTQSGRESNEAPQLQVKIDLLSQDYCWSSMDPGPTLGRSAAVHISFNLNATLRNAGSSSIILCKKYVAAHAPSLFAANSDGTAGPLAYSLLEDRVIPNEDPVIPNTRSYPRNLDKDYAILQPGGSMSTPVTTEVITSLTSGLDSPKSAFTPGNYFLQVWVYDWQGSPEALQTLRDRWRKQGYLIGQGSMSNRIQVSLDPLKNLAMCKN
jgi:hypothetical protein